MTDGQNMRKTEASQYDHAFVLPVKVVLTTICGGRGAGGRRCLLTAGVVGAPGRSSAPRRLYGVRALRLLLWSIVVTEGTAGQN